MDTLVHYSMIKNSRDTNVSAAIEQPFSEFCKAFDGHNVVDEKDTIMFCPWIFKDVAGNRDGDNTIGTTMVCLDFDDDSGWTVEDARAVFAKYEHFGYTSFNHQKIGLDRFRIVLPLADVTSKEEVATRRQSIYKMYAGVDSSSLSISRSFYIPVCPAEKLHLAESWTNSGELFDVLKFGKQPVPVFTRPPAPLNDLKMQWLLEALKNTYLGHEPEWRNVGLAMCNEGFSFDDFCYVTIGGMMNQKTQSDCAKKWRAIERDVARGVQINAGYLINTVRKNGHDYKTYLKQQCERITNSLNIGETRNG